MWASTPEATPVAPLRLVAADGVTTFHETPVLQMHDGLIREAVAACRMVTFVLPGMSLAVFWEGVGCEQS